MARVCAVLANCHRNPESKPEPYSTEDFMPKTRTEMRRQERAERKASQLRLAAEMKAFMATQQAGAAP